MTFKAPNSAHNISVADAAAFLSKLAKLGLPMGPLHLNGQSGGGSEQADYVPVDEATDAEKDGKVCCIAFYGGDFHRLALLKHAFGAGGLAGFKNVASRLCVYSVDAAALNIPGAAKALDRLVDKP